MTEMPVTPAPIAPQTHDHTVAIWSIICTTIIMLVCIAGCSSVLITLAMKIP